MSLVLFGIQVPVCGVCAVVAIGSDCSSKGLFVEGSFVFRWYSHPEMLVIGLCQLNTG